MPHAFQILVDQSSTAMGVLDREGRFLYVNRAFASLCGPGTEPDDLTDVEWSTLLADDQRDVVTRVLASTTGETWEGEVRQMARNRASTVRFARMFPLMQPGERAAVALAITDRPPATRPEAASADSSRARQSAVAPVLPIAPRVILVPVLGALDARRSLLLTRSVLGGINAHRARSIILDVTGLLDVDMRAADYLAKTVLAARLKGARTVVCGLTEQASEALTDIEVDWRGIATVGDLRTALSLALGYVGISLQSEPRGGEAVVR